MLVTSKIIPVDVNMVLRRMRKISGGEVPLFPNSTEDLQKMEAKMEKTEWTVKKSLDLTTTKMQTIVFCFDPSIRDDKLAYAVLNHNKALSRAFI